MNRLLLLPVLVFAGACAPTVLGDHFRLEVGNTWEYFLIDGGEDGEFWTLDARDADDNAESGRGDIYFHMVRTIPDELGPGTSAVYDQRRFNIGLEQDLTGSEPRPIGWTYRWLPDAQKEGDRSEYFVVTPGSRADWSDSWSYDFGEPGGSDFYFEVDATYREEPIQTSFGTFDDVLEYRRFVEITSYTAGDTLVQTSVTTENWAKDVGLVHIQIEASDGTSTEAVLRTTNAAEVPGT